MAEENSHSRLETVTRVNTFWVSFQARDAISGQTEQFTSVVSITAVEVEKDTGNRVQQLHVTVMTENIKTTRNVGLALTHGKTE